MKKLIIVITIIVVGITIGLLSVCGILKLTGNEAMLYKIKDKIKK